MGVSKFNSLYMHVITAGVNQGRVVYLQKMLLNSLYLVLEKMYYIVGCI